MCQDRPIQKCVCFNTVAWIPCRFRSAGKWTLPPHDGATVLKDTLKNSDIDNESKSIYCMSFCYIVSCRKNRVKKKKTTTILLILLTAVCFGVTGLADRYCRCGEECCVFSIKSARHKTGPDPIPACCLSESQHGQTDTEKNIRVSPECHPEKQSGRPCCLGCDSTSRHLYSVAAVASHKLGGTGHFTVALSGESAIICDRFDLEHACRICPVGRSSPIYLEILSFLC